MDSRIAAQERHEFSARLKDALQKAGVPPSASKIASEFNLRADGATVTSHAVRKWLMGEALPTHERLIILATWLGVHASWLLYGEAANTDFALTAEAPLLDSVELALLRDYRRLTPEGQHMTRDVLRIMLKSSLAQGEK
jgi:transcriptional regulator with XRE-family HTH domain